MCNLCVHSRACQVVNTSFVGKPTDKSLLLVLFWMEKHRKVLFVASWLCLGLFVAFLFLESRSSCLPGWPQTAYIAKDSFDFLTPLPRLDTGMCHHTQSYAVLRTEPRVLYMYGMRCILSPVHIPLLSFQFFILRHSSS